MFFLGEENKFSRILSSDVPNGSRIYLGYVNERTSKLWTNDSASINGKEIRYLILHTDIHVHIHVSLVELIAIRLAEESPRFAFDPIPHHTNGKHAYLEVSLVGNWCERRYLGRSLSNSHWKTGLFVPQATKTLRASNQHIAHTSILPHRLRQHIYKHVWPKRERKRNRTKDPIS